MVVKGTLQGFYPSAINVTVGQTVTFTMGPMVFSCAFDQVGNFTYHCADHPFMTVAVTVRE
jgi:plastocyanin